MAKRYGISYKGSKNKMAEALSEAVPFRGIDNFYDLFAGGCAVTHRMMETDRYRRYFANDLNGDVVTLFRDAVNGKYKDEKRWISREDFFRLKDTDPYVRYLWSFGNNGRDYLYSREIEPYKKAFHYAIVFDDWSLLKELCPEVWESTFEVLKGVANRHERRIRFGSAIKHCTKGNDSAEKINRCAHLEHLERLERLECLECLERLTITSKDYCNVEVLPNSVIYCDIPYKGCDDYGKRKGHNFDHEAFYDWCERQKELVLVSEYEMPRERFAEVWSVAHRCVFSATTNNAVTERLFVPIGQLMRYKELMGLGREKKPIYEQMSLFG